MSVAFVVGKNTPKIRFLASLSDGRTVIQDEVAGKQHAWHRLRDFLRDNRDIKITGLRLQSQNKKDVVMPSNQKGYCFIKKEIKIFPRGGEATYIGIGYYDGHKATIRYFQLPYLKSSFTEIKTREKAGFALIENV